MIASEGKSFFGSTLLFMESRNQSQRRKVKMYKTEMKENNDFSEFKTITESLDR